MVHQKLCFFFPLLTNLTMPIVFISSGGGRQNYRLQWRRSSNRHASKLISDDGRQWLPPPDWRRPLKRSASINKILAVAANWEATL